MVRREDEEDAALVLLMIKHSLPMDTKRSVVEAMERQWRVFILFPRKKRNLRIPIYEYDGYIATVDSATKKDPPKADTFDGPLTESSKRPTRNSKKRPLLSPPLEQPPKKAKRKANGRFDAGASSSTSTKENPPKADTLNVPLTESSERTTRNSKTRPLLFPPSQQQPKQAKRKANAGASTEEPTPEWLLQLIRSKNGANPKKILNKGLTASDVKSVKHRLSIPRSMIVDLDFLTPAEETIIKLHYRKVRKTGVDATLVASDLREFELNLRLWDVGKTPMYNLVSGWNNVVEIYQLKENNQIRLWSFHANGKLYFAFVPLLPTDSGNSTSGTMSSALVIKD